MTRASLTPRLVCEGRNFAASLAFFGGFVRPIAACLISLWLERRQAAFAANTIPGTGVVQTGLHYYAVRNLENPSAPVLRGTAGSQGYAHDSLILPANTRFREWILQARTLRVATADYTTPNDGSRFDLPEFRLEAVVSPDPDGDGLHNLAEFILGTAPDNPDTDGDGMPDGFEVQSGSDPLSGLAVRTGILGSTETRGPALDVCAIDNVAIVAEGAAGVGVFNIFSGLSPTRVAQVATQGNARRVACSGSLIAVADGPGGLAVVDIGEVSQAKVLHQVPLGPDIQAVEASAGVAYAGSGSGGLFAVDMRSGRILKSTLVGEAIQDLRVVGDHLYVLAGTRLQVVSLLEAGLQRQGEVALGSAGVRLTGAYRGLYVLHSDLYSLYDLARPESPALRRSSAPGPSNWQFLALNGSGALIAAHAPGTSPQPRLVLYRATDTGDEFITRLETPGIPRAASLFHGLAYVADDSSRLHVVNYMTYDSKRVAPSIALETTFQRNGSGSWTTEAGQPFRVTANVTDDVQVRTVEFYANGQRLVTDGSFPFESRLTASLLSSGRTNLVVRARATDTGGNSAWSEELTVLLTPDRTPPRVVATVPRRNDVVGELTLVVALFDGPMNAASVRPSAFQIRGDGADRRLGTPDDPMVTEFEIEYRPDLPGVFLRFSSPVPAGRYRVVAQRLLADASGNSLAAPFAWDFWVLSDSDRDQDGVPDAEELRLGLDANQPDSDGDGLVDGEEDLDGDGLTTRWELLLGYDPRLADTGGSGARDGNKDRDLDMLSDSREVALGLDPFAIDTDGDGWDDASELAELSDPADPRSGPKVVFWSLPVAAFNGHLESVVSDQPITLMSYPVSVFNGALEEIPANTTVVLPGAIVTLLNTDAD